MQPENFTNKISCGLCLDIVSYTNSEIKEAAKSLEVILPNLKLERIYKHEVCKACCLKLFAAFTFKTTCMDTENIIVSHINAGTLSVIELKEVYLKMNGNGRLSNIGESQRICRLCLHLVSYGFVSLNEVDNNIIDTYIPQVNIHATKDPVICGSCFDLLCTHGSFVKNCFPAQSIYKSADKQLYIKTEEIEIKREDCHSTQATCKNIDNQSFIKSEEVEIKPEEGDQDNDFSSHNLHEDTTENKNEHFSEDAGETFKGSLKDNIVLIPKYSSEIQMHKCNICIYETKNKSHLKLHQLIHKDTSEIQMYKCDACDYETKRKPQLKVHQLVHKNPTEVRMYKCDTCTYDSKYKSNLKGHQLRHRLPSEIQMYKCDSCSYETKYRYNLKSHQLIHIGGSSGIRMYRCDACTYETKYKCCLKTHLLKHKDSSEIQMNTCDTYSYAAKRKSYVKRHKESSENEMYKCDVCHYKTENRDDLKSHQLLHKGLSKIQIYKTGACTYETRYMNWLEDKLQKDFG